LLAHVGGEFLQDPLDAFGEIHILQARAQFLVRDFAQDGDGIVKHVLPAARGEVLENFLRLLVPGPPEIAGQLVQARDDFIQFVRRERFLYHNSF
jgi:hypothetical protein